MKFRMLLGTVVSGGLAWGVLSLFGFFSGPVRPLEIAVAVLLTGVYLVAFLSGVMGRGRRDLFAGENVTWIEFEASKKEEAALQPAA